MRKIFLSGILAVFLCSCASFQSNASYSTTGSIAIVEAISDGTTSIQENKHLTRYMVQITEQTFKSEILVLMREHVQPLLVKGAVLEDCENDCLVQIGKHINAAYITQAYIVKDGDEYSVTTEMFNVASGQKIASATTDVSSESSIERAVFLSTAQMFNQFTGK